MPRKTRRSRSYKKRGGAAYSLMGAPLDYAMTPGSTYTVNPAVAVYDRFPIDPTVNPQVVSDLDVYFGSALSQGCGTENSSLVVPADMGSNQVGGSRSCSSRKQRGAGFFDNITTNMGDFTQMASSHLYLASAYPNTAQSLTNSWQGKLDTVPTSSDPTDHTWKMATEMTRNPINSASYVTTMGPSTHLIKSFEQTGAGRRRKTLAGKRAKRTQRAKSSKRTRRNSRR